MNKKQYDHLPYADLTGSILECCFEVMNELGSGFLESVYKNALLVALRDCLRINIHRFLGLFLLW